MSSLSDYLDSVTTQDTKERLNAHGSLASFLSDPRSSLECDDFTIDQLVEGLDQWIKSSNYKVSLNGLEVLCLMVDRMGEQFKAHVTTVLPAVIDRLGDSKDQVRDMAKQLLLKLMRPGSTPQYVFDRLGPAFHHKLVHVKEGVLITLQNTINRYGAGCLHLSRIVPDICKLLEDPSPQVREAAVNSLVEVYRHVGEKVRNDLKHKGLSTQRLNHLYDKFDELRSSGNMLPTADIGLPSRSSSTSHDEPEFDFVKPASRKPLSKKPSTSSGKRPSANSASVGGSGAVDEELFIKSFEDVPNVKIFSSRDVQEQAMKIKDCLSDSNITWEKRIDHLKLLRSLLISGAADYDDFYQSLRMLESPLILAVKDLRSQVVREACISIAYMSQQLGSKFDHFAESVLPSLINLIPNSAKVMSTSGIVCIRFIMQFVHTNRLIPIITSHLTSKNNIIRRFSCEIVNQMLHTWPTHCLEKHIAILQDSIKKGISDADSEARAHSRKAFWGFADHFKSQADALLNSLEASKQKMLQGEISNSSSNSSLNGDHSRPRSRSRAASEERSSGYGQTKSLRRPMRISSSRSDAGDGDRTDRDLSQTRKAGSRSNSPTSARRQLAYAKTASARIDTGLGPRRVPRTPVGSRSQGASREASPARSFKSGERRLSSSSKVSSGRKTPVLAERLLRPGSECEDALHDALSRGPHRKRFDTYDSDDAASETSSVCSEQSHSSRGGRTSEDMHSIITQLGSASHLDRKDGLLSLQHLLRTNRPLSRVELKKVTEMFTRMFHDPHSKVFNTFLDTLIELVYLQSTDLGDWLHILLPRLLNKAGGEMLGSVANKIQKTLDVVRDCFPYDQQFITVSKLFPELPQGLNNRVRVSILNYYHSLIQTMDPSDFTNSMDSRLAVTKIINWTTEPRNTDVRKASQSVLIALFNLNPAEISLVLSELPSIFQDDATRILNSHIRTASDGMGDVLSPRNVASPPGHTRSRPPSRQSQGHPDDIETENLNPEDIFNSIKKTSADIQSLSINSKLEHYDDVKKKHDFTSQDSGIQDLRTDSPDGLDHKKAFNYTHKSGNGHVSHPGNSQSSLFAKSEPAPSREDTGKIICDILEELSNHNERVEQRKNAMQCLQEVVEKGCLTDELQEEHFRPLLLILLETLGDNNGDIKVLALKSLQKMLQKFPHRFENYAELTILKVLELHKDDTFRDVPYAAGEVENTIVQVLPAEQNFRILNPLIQTMAYHIACGAIQMMTKVVEKMPKDVLESSLANLIPGLFKNFEHPESPVRKASCFCLVAIYLRVEEAMRPYIDTLNNHRMKLLNLYIKKRKMEDTKATK